MVIEDSRGFVFFNIIISSFVRNVAISFDIFCDFPDVAVARLDRGQFEIRCSYFILFKSCFLLVLRL